MTTTNGSSEITTPQLTMQTNGDGPINGAVHDPTVGHIRATDIVGEMQTAYLDYAMSVIVARALPDVRDGLKPVHRRILFAMSHDLYLTYNKPHRKSARIVGEVLGKYHPHGDVAVYDAMVRMAQEFSLRYPLVDGQGNFGSIDGDGAAAMRYTEARMAEITNLMLDDLDKDTVDWHDNFDNSLEEPNVLPAALPNLLINGASGIAVGMATNVPPHNLNEIVDALVYLIDHYQTVEDVTVDELMHFVKGPDFPTGGILYRFREDKGDEQTDVIAQGYAMGKARLVMQAKAHFEEMSRGRSRIVVTELPYQTNKTALIERIATLARDGKIEGITDLRDESDRTGMRIVVELTRNASAQGVLKDLFKYTPLQQTFGMQMLALVDGQPRLLGLKRALHHFIQHREEIIRRRSEYDLAKARDRAHIVEGLLKALDILDEVIATIRRSQTVETARNNLVKNFKFTEIQAQAILDMQLRRLAALERKKLRTEYDELLKRIAYLEDLLAHPEKILAVIREELLAQKEKYGDARRTQIVDRTKGTLTSTDLLPQQEVWVTVSADGDLRRQDVGKLTESTLNKLAKHGQVAMFTANTRDWLYLFTRDGRAIRIATHELPQNGAPKHASELSPLTRRDTITAALSIPRTAGTDTPGYLFLVTVLGDVKRVTIGDVAKTIDNEFSVINVNTKDRLNWVLTTTGDNEVMLVTTAGQSIRFQETDVRSMGLPAGGVAGIKLRKQDAVVYAAVVDAEGTLVTMTEKGYAKRTPLTEYSRQGRNGSGIVTHKPNTRTGPVAAAMLLEATTGDEELVATITAKNQIKPVIVAAIPVMGRGVQGKLVIEMARTDHVRLLKRMGDATTPLPPDPTQGNGSIESDAPATGTPATASTNGSTANRRSSNGRASTRTPSGRANAKPTASKPKREAVSAKSTTKSTNKSASASSAKSRGGTTAKPRTTKGKASTTKRTQSGTTANTPTTRAKRTQVDTQRTKTNPSGKAKTVNTKASNTGTSNTGTSNTGTSNTGTSGTRTSKASNSKASKARTTSAKSNRATSSTARTRATEKNATKGAGHRSAKASKTAANTAKTTPNQRNSAENSRKNTRTAKRVSTENGRTKSAATAQKNTRKNTQKSTGTKTTKTRRRPQPTAKSKAAAKDAQAQTLELFPVDELDSQSSGATKANSQKSSAKKGAPVKKSGSKPQSKKRKLDVAVSVGGRK